MPSDPTPNVVDILAQATNAHQEGDLSRASKLYLEVLELERNNVDALHRVGHRMLHHHAIGRQAACTDRFDVGLLHNFNRGVTHHP